MPEVGRRGSTSLMYEIVISLILLGLFAVTAFLYVNANAKGEQYYSQFYAADLGTTADLVVAGNGDVLLRYDNLKPTLDLAFWLVNGRIGVAKTPVPEGFTRVGLAGLSTETTTSLTEPSYAAEQYYGRAQDYPAPKVLVNPTYLALRKINEPSYEAFSIDEAETLLDQCPTAEPELELSDAVVWFDIEGLTAEERRRAREAFAETLPSGVAQAAREEQATIRFYVKRATGESSLSFSPTNQDGAQFACLFARHLSLLSLHEWEKPELQPSGSAFTVTATVTTGRDVILRPEDIGKAAALALARMYG